MTKQPEIIYYKHDATQETRLDKFLFQHYPAYSRSYFQDLIKNEQVTINEKAVNKSSYQLRDGDKICVCFPPPKEYNVTPLPVDFEIVDVQPDFIVINKPAGLVVHNSESNKDEISLVNGLLFYFKELKDLIQEDTPQRPGIVHRIDRNTSGLLLVARNEKAQIALGKMFHNRQIHKTYLAIVDGHPEREGRIDFPIGRNPVERHKMSHAGISSRNALTCYSVLAYYENSSLLAAKIITGRTHQIRVHCAAIGHGILGDETYGKKTPHIQRQALHAWKLSFDYLGKSYSYCKSMPNDMVHLIKWCHQK